MWDLKLRLVNMLGLITLIVVAALLIDYFRLLRRPTPTSSHAVTPPGRLH